jgi:hypothetical protein
MFARSEVKNHLSKVKKPLAASERVRGESREVVAQRPPSLLDPAQGHPHRVSGEIILPRTRQEEVPPAISGKIITFSQKHSVSDIDFYKLDNNKLRSIRYQGRQLSKIAEMEKIDFRKFFVKSDIFKIIQERIPH